MKKNYLLLLLLLFFHPNHSQSVLDQIITGISVRQSNDNTIMVQWSSSIRQSNFTIYYNTNQAITDRFILRDSELIFNGELSGQSQGNLFSYSKEILINTDGNYYFAVIIDSSEAFDNIARSLVSTIDTRANYNLIPELNTTIQALTYKKPKQTSTIVNPKSLEINTPIPQITSLILQSTEDIFRLRWSVYPKDRSEYIFAIYRSRYPLTQFTSPQFLPEYARVTNQFYFEDRNISFESPYYYAVAAIDSRQWDLGVNVFTQPAVLLKDSPPFEIKPVINFVKRKREFTIQNADLMSEEEIQLAVQRTLENLRVIPVMTSSTRGVEDIIGETVSGFMPLNEDEVSNLNLFNELDSTGGFSQIGNEPRLQSIRNNTKIESFAREMFEQRNEVLGQLELLKEMTLLNDKKDLQKVQEKINQLTRRMESFYKKQKNLLTVDRLNNQQFSYQLHDYYQERDKNRLYQYQIQGLTRDFNLRRSVREEELKSKIADLKKEQNKVYIGFIQQVYNTKKNHYTDFASRLLSQKVTSRATEINPNRFQQPVFSNFKSAENFDNNDTLLPLKELKSEIEDLEVYLTSYENTEDAPEYKSVPKPNLEEIFDEDEILEGVKSSYDDVVIEKVYSVEERQNQNGVVVREVWLRENRNIWNQKNKFWNERTKEILGDSQYCRIRSKWLNPSTNIAKNESKRALQRGDMGEALYLLNKVSSDPDLLMALGKTYYALEAYREAFSVFIVALEMEIPDAKMWLDRSSEKILGRPVSE